MDKRQLPLPAKYKSVFLWAAVILAVFFLLRNLQPRKLAPTFTMRFTDQFARAKTVEIADFAEGENWKGNYTYDSVRTFDGEVGMNIFSIGPAPVTIVRQRSLDLSGYDTLYAYLFVPSREMAGQTDKLAVGFRDGKGRETAYAVKNLKEGWNLVTMPKNAFFARDFDWKTVDLTTIVLASRANATVQIALDRLWAQMPLGGTTASFVSYPDQYVNLKTMNKDTYLHLAAPERQSIVFNKKVGRRDFSYTASFAPLRFGTFGLEFQTDKKAESGYFFTVEGARMDRWQLIRRDGKSEKMLAEGELKNNTFEKEAYLFLRAERTGGSIKLSLSFNNKDFLPVTEVKDSSLPEGYAGISYKGAYLLDSVTVLE